MKARLALLGMALTAVTACGGDDDGGGEAGADATAKPEQQTEQQAAAEPGPALTKEEFAEQANAACRANEQRIVMIAEEFAKTERSGFEPTAGEIRKFVVATLPEFRRMLDDLALITPPEPDQQGFKDLIEQGRDAVTRVEEIKDDSRTLLSREFGDAFAVFNRGAFGLGLSDCGAAERETFGH